MIIKFDPHGFVVFLTLAMGMVYAIFNSRSGWGFWKIAIIGVIVLPSLYHFVVIGRVLEVGAGSLVGWLYARGGLRLPSLNPFSGLGEYFGNRRADKAHKKAQRNAEREEMKARRSREKIKNKDKQSRAKGQSNREKEARQRQEQAKAQREQAKAQEDTNSANAGTNQSDQSQERKPPREPKTSVDNRTHCEILGVSRNATQAQIKKAYSILRSRYHPDKYEHMSDTFKLEAAEEFKKVQKAWKILSKKP